MASQIKGITIEIGGETTGLEKSLSSVNKAAYNIQKELGEVEKQLKFDPGNTELLAQKQQLLGDAVKNTAEKLKGLESAQSQVNQQFKNGDLSPEQYRAFNRELEKTKSQLDELKGKTSSVKAIGDAFQDIKSKVSDVVQKLGPLVDGLKKAGDAAGKITMGGINTVGAGMNAAKKGLEIYGGAAIAAGGAVTAMSVKAAGAADDINTMATQTGLSTDTIQKFQYASELIDVPLETITGSMSKLTKNMSNAQKGTGKQADAFKKLGVSTTDSSGKLRDNEAVFNDSIKALGKIKNSTERDAVAMDLFGKSAQDLNPLIMGGADALKTLGDEAQANGMIMGKEALGNANAFNDSLDKIKANAGGAGNLLGGVFAGGLTVAASSVASAIPTITGSLANLFSGKNMEGSQAKLTTDLVNTLKSVIGGLAKNLPTFLAGFNAVIISLIDAVAQVLPSIISGLIMPLVDGFTKLVQAIIPFIPILLPILVDGAMQLFLGLLDGLNLVIPQLTAMLPEIISKVSAVLIENLPLIITGGIKLLLSLITGITNSIPQLITAVISLIPVITSALIANLPALISAGIQLIIALATGLPQAIPSIIAAIPQIISSIINTLMATDWLSVGINVIKGIAGGLISGISSIDFGSIFGNIVGGIKKFFGIQSPSTLFRDEIGENLGLGVGEGFVGSMGKVTKDMQKALPTSFDTDVAVNSAVSGINKISSANNERNINENIKHSGTIRVEGINNKGELNSVVDIVMNQLRREARMA